jgi:hypothetical protein
MFFLKSRGASPWSQSAQVRVFYQIKVMDPNAVGFGTFCSFTDPVYISCPELVGLFYIAKWSNISFSTYFESLVVGSDLEPGPE